MAEVENKDTRVLIVEDDRSAARGLAMALGRAGVGHIDVAENFAAAQEKMAEALSADKPYDVALLDINFPIDNTTRETKPLGLEVAATLKDVSPTTVRVVHSTMRSAEHNINQFGLEETENGTLVMGKSDYDKIPSLLEFVREKQQGQGEGRESSAGTEPKAHRGPNIPQEPRSPGDHAACPRARWGRGGESS